MFNTVNIYFYFKYLFLLSGESASVEQKLLEPQDETKLIFIINGL